MGCFWFLHDSFADLSNIALGKQAWQSSTLDHIYIPTADKAVDGNSASNFTYQSCTHTNEQYHPWWAVDLGAKNLVSEVVITNRGDCCGKKNNTESPQRRLTVKQSAGWLDKNVVKYHNSTSIPH